MQRPAIVGGKNREGVVLDLQLMQQRVHPTDRAVQQPERVAEQSAGRATVAGQALKENMVSPCSFSLVAKGP